MKETFPHNFSSTSGADAWNSLGNIIPTSFLRQLVLKGWSGCLGGIMLPGSGAEGRDGRREASKVKGSNWRFPKINECSSLDWLRNCFFQLGTPGVKNSIHTCKPVSFQLWAYSSIYWMLPQPWGWGECACVLATQSTKGEGSVGTGAGCMGAGRGSLVLLCQFTEAARLMLAESLPATLRPGDSLWS